MDVVWRYSNKVSEKHIISVEYTQQALVLTLSHTNDIQSCFVFNERTEKVLGLF